MYLITVKFVQGAYTADQQQEIETRMDDAVAAVTGEQAPRATQYIVKEVKAAPRRPTPARKVMHLDFATWHARIAGTARQAA